MTQSHRSVRSQRRIHGILLAGAFVLSSAGPVQSALAESPQAASRAPGVSTYQIVPAPSGPISLCPGQTQQVAVRLTRSVTRIVGGQQVQGAPADVPRARISARPLDSSVASVDPATARAVGLQFAAGGRASSPRFGAWFTVTGRQPGSTYVTFKGVGVLTPGVTSPGDDLAPLPQPPSDSVSVEVNCQFKVTLSAAWTIPGRDLTHDASFLLSDVGLAPDPDGNFSVDATVPNRVVRGGSVCGGVSTVNASQAHFKGNVSPTGLIHVDVTFDPVSHAGSEGCLGKSLTAQSTLQPLSFDADLSSGRRRFFMQLPHILVDDAGSLTGNTIVYLTVIQP